MKCNTRRAGAAKLTAAYQTIGKSILAYLDASAGCVVCDLCGYKKKRLQDMYDTTQNDLHYMMDQYGEDKDDQRTRATAALNKVKKKLAEYAAFDFDEATAAYPPDDVFHRTWHNQADIHKHGTREKFMADMEVVVQTYHAQILHWFWLHKAFGRDRLMKLYGLLRQDYNLIVTEYLRCSAAGDKKIKDMLKERQDRLQAIGLEFVEA
jgi:hypothetical protein